MDCAAFALFASACLSAGADKMLHYAAGSTVAAVIETYWPAETGLAAATIVGLTKELYDRARPSHASEVKDFYATLAGGITTYYAGRLAGRGRSAWLPVPGGIVFLKRF